MTLRKITIDNSVRYIPKSEQMIENKTKTIPPKQNKKISQNKKFLNNVSASGFKLLK